MCGFVECYLGWVCVFKSPSQSNYRKQEHFVSLIVEKNPIFIYLTCFTKALCSFLETCGAICKSISISLQIYLILFEHLIMHALFWKFIRDKLKFKKLINAGLFSRW